MHKFLPFSSFNIPAPPRRSLPLRHNSLPIFLSIQKVQPAFDANIYACLFTRGDGTFHYALGVDAAPAPQSGPITLQKLHATNPAGSWKLETKKETLRQKDQYGTCCVVLRIGKLGSFQIEELEKLLLPTIPTSNERESRYASQFWFIRAIQALKTKKVIHCTNVDALTKELKELGDRQSNCTEKGEGYILATSDTCW